MWQLTLIHYFHWFQSILFSSLQLVFSFYQERSKFCLNAHTHTLNHTCPRSLSLFLIVKQSDTGTHTHKQNVNLYCHRDKHFFHYEIWHVLQDVQVRKRLFVQQHRSVFSHIKPIPFSTGSNKSPVKTATMRAKFSGVARWTVSATMPCSLCGYAVDLLVEKQLCASQVGQVHHHQQILWRGGRQNSSCWHPVKKTSTCIQKIQYSTKRFKKKSIPHLKPWCSPNVRWEDSKYNHFTHVNNQKKVIQSSV